MVTKKEAPTIEFAVPATTCCTTPRSADISPWLVALVALVAVETALLVCLLALGVGEHTAVVVAFVVAVPIAAVIAGRAPLGQLFGHVGGSGERALW